MNFSEYLLVFAVAVVSGAINSVAGGGTILTFPALLSVGLSSKIANTTNTMALWPASLAAAWSFRGAYAGCKHIALQYTLISVAGSLAGAWFLNYTSDRLFERIVPWLILLAAVLFILQEPLVRLLRLDTVHPDTHAARPQRHFWLMLIQFFIGIYGGYFGAGMGIMMLAGLGFMQIGDIYHMNFLKNFAAFSINIVAAILFGLWGLVDWRVAPVMAAGAIFGGLSGAGLAKKVGPRVLRMVVSLIGLGLAGYYFFWRS